MPPSVFWDISFPFFITVKSSSETTSSFSVLSFRVSDSSLKLLRSFFADIDLTFETRCISVVAFLKEILSQDKLKKVSFIKNVMSSDDADNIYVILSTGNVKGTLLSSKIFNVTSKTGIVEVPETYTGGICKIKVSTGNIKISYK